MVSVSAYAQDGLGFEDMPSPTPVVNEEIITEEMPIQDPTIQPEMEPIAEPVPSSETEILIPVENVTPPASDALAPPVTPPPGAEQGAPDVTVTTTVPADAPAANEPITDDDVFYDADSLVPEGQLARKAPRNVNPRNEPATKLIIVKKDARADSRQAQLVAASRAIKLGRYSSALEIYNELYRKNKRDPNILMGRAMALQKLGLAEEAIVAYEELLDLRPNNIEARVNMLGLIGEQFPAVALRQLKDLRERNPNDVALVAQLAITEARIGNFDSAMRYMGVATSMEPNNANHYYNLAIIADQAGARREAVKYYEEALEVDTIYGGGRSVPREVIYTRLAQIR